MTRMVESVIKLQTPGYALKKQASLAGYTRAVTPLECLLGSLPHPSARVKCIDISVKVHNGESVLPSLRQKSNRHQ